MSQLVPPHLALNRGTVITASKRPPATTGTVQPEKRHKPLAHPLKLSLETAQVLGPLAASFYKLAQCEERIDQAIDRGKHELRAVLSGPVDGKDAFPALNACNPRQMLRSVRVYVTSTYELHEPGTVPPLPSGEELSPPGTWTLQVTAAVRSGHGGGDDAFVEAVPLHQYFDIAHVQVASSPTITKAEWRAGSESADEPPHCPGLSITRTTAGVAEMPTRLALRLKQRKEGQGAGPVAPLSRVTVNRGLCSLLNLSAEAHYAYHEVEENLWM